MVVKLLFIILFLVLFYFLVVELLAARKWKRLVKYPQEFGFTDEEYEGIVKRDREIRKQSKFIEWYWSNPVKDLRKARKLGFINMPFHVNVGIAEEMHSGPGAYYRGRLLAVEAFEEFWKDKWNTPRFEFNPHIYITLFGTFGINIVWSFYYEFGAPREERYDNDQYWEQALWCIYYCGGDLEKARNTWPWRNEKEESTWDEKYVKQKYRKQ